DEVPDDGLGRGRVVTRADLARALPSGDVELREARHRQGPAALAREGAVGREEQIDGAWVAGEIRKVALPIVGRDAPVRDRVPVNAQVHSLRDLTRLVAGLERNAIPGLREPPQGLVRRRTGGALISLVGWRASACDLVPEVRYGGIAVERLVLATAGGGE